MSAENTKVIDGVAQLTVFDPSSKTPTSTQALLYATDGGPGVTTTEVGVKDSGGTRFVNQGVSGGVILLDASGVQWLVQVSPTGALSATSGTY